MPLIVLREYAGKISFRALNEPENVHRPDPGIPEPGAEFNFMPAYINAQFAG